MNIVLGKNFSLPNDKTYTSKQLDSLKCRCENCKKIEKISKELFEALKTLR